VLNSLQTYLKEGTVYYSLEAHTHKDTLRWHLLELKSKKQELFITNEETYTDLKAIPPDIKPNCPLFLVVNTAEVLTKIIPTKGATNAEAIVNSTFPNLDFDVFYYEVATTNNTSLVSICKRELIANYLRQLQELKVFPMRYALGISPITAIVNFAEAPVLYTSSQQLSIEEKSVQKSEAQATTEASSGKVQDINGLNVRSASLLGFSSIAGHILNGKGAQVNFETEQIALQKDFSNKRKFNLLLKFGIGGILALLLINFFFFNHYYTGVETLKATSEVNSMNKERLVALKTEVEQKEERVNAILANANSKASFYLDEIGKGVPQSILFNQIVYPNCKSVSWLYLEKCVMGTTFLTGSRP